MGTASSASACPVRLAHLCTFRKNDKIFPLVSCLFDIFGSASYFWLRYFGSIFCLFCLFFPLEKINCSFLSYFFCFSKGTGQKVKSANRS